MILYYDLPQEVQQEGVDIPEHQTDRDMMTLDLQTLRILMILMMTYTSHSLDLQCDARISIFK